MSQTTSAPKTKKRSSDTSSTPVKLFDRVQLSKMIGKSVRAVAAAAAARNVRLVPMPIKIGRFNFWTQESVDAWIAAQKQVEPLSPPSRRRGAPTKAERRAKATAAALAEAQAQAAAPATGEGA